SRRRHCPCHHHHRRGSPESPFIRLSPVSDPVLVQVDDHVAVLTVNDPERRNAVTAEISAALRAAIDAAEANPDVHAVIVTGAGKAFCAGADLTALGAATEDGLRGIYDGFLAVANCALPT